MKLRETIELREKLISRRTRGEHVLSGAARKLHKPHDIVKASGIYDVIHDDNHKEHHQVTCVKSDHFPPCRNCGNNVRYRIAIAAHHLKHDPDLENA